MNQKGFTLLETIVTIVLVGVMSAMVVPFFLSGVTRAGLPLNQMRTPLGLQTVFANIIADYNSNGTYLHDLSQLNSRIASGNYGLTASHTITKDPNYRFNPSDTNASLKVTIKDNASNQTATYIFTRQLLTLTRIRSSARRSSR
jgi:prepilin-type N-terminal cleavage/methylation domain-containing protein